MQSSSHVVLTTCDLDIDGRVLRSGYPSGNRRPPVLLSVRHSGLRMRIAIVLGWGILIEVLGTVLMFLSPLTIACALLFIDSMSCDPNGSRLITLISIMCLTNSNAGGLRLPDG